MTPSALMAFGILLHGKRWQLDTARTLAVDPRLLRRWLCGDRPIPGWVASALRIELAGRAEEIRKFLDGAPA